MDVLARALLVRAEGGITHLASACRAHDQSSEFTHGGAGGISSRVRRDLVASGRKFMILSGEGCDPRLSQHQGCDHVIRPFFRAGQILSHKFTAPVHISRDILRILYSIDPHTSSCPTWYTSWLQYIVYIVYTFSRSLQYIQYIHRPMSSQP
jgi:hypothetical protein